MSDIDTLTGRDLDRAVAVALGWTRYDEPPPVEIACAKADGVEPRRGDWWAASGYPFECAKWDGCPACSAIDGPLSPMLCWLRERGWWFSLVTNCVNAGVRIDLHRPAESDPVVITNIRGTTINEACARAVIRVAELIRKENEQ